MCSAGRVGMMLALALTCILTVGCGRSATSSAMKDYEFTFDQTHPAGVPADVVHVYIAVDRAGRIQDLYAVTRLSSGAVVTERSWNSADPDSELGRDWTTCQQIRQESPEAIPVTVATLEASILGPATAPPAATVISANTWQIAQGIAIMTVRQLGPGITDRIVSVGLPGKKPGTTIRDATLTPVAAVPHLITTWSACRPSPGT